MADMSESPTGHIRPGSMRVELGSPYDVAQGIICSEKTKVQKAH